jgi:hypothetical protein
MGLAHERFTSSTYSRREIALGFQGCVDLEYNPTTGSEVSFAWLPGDEPQRYAGGERPAFLKLFYRNILESYINASSLYRLGLPIRQKHV